MKKLYGIGTGPGDPDLLTLKAVKKIKESKTIFAPNNKGTSMALDTAREYLKEKKIVLIDFPMGNVIRDDYKNAAKIIFDEIGDGDSGAFLTIGDPMIYSTFIYIMEELEDVDIDIEVISGIPSFVAGAASSKRALTVKGENFLLCDEYDEEIVRRVDSVAILKTSKEKEKILDSLEYIGFDYKYVKRASLKEEKILKNREDILKDRDYISLVLAKKFIKDK